MLNGYRKRFVLSNLLLVGTVLLVVFVVLGVSQYRSTYHELRVTMAQVLDPLNGPNDNFRRLHDAEDDLDDENLDDDDLEEARATPWGERPQTPDGTPPKKPDDLPEMSGDRTARAGQQDAARETNIAREKITTVFFDAETGEISVTRSSGDVDDAFLSAAVEEILAQESEFGRLHGYGLFYYRTQAASGCKIALADVSYLSSRVLTSVLVLASGFLGAMGLVLLVSIWLSKLAAKPMENAMQMQRQFVDDVSHDLKTPITVILANNSILKDSPQETIAAQRQWIDATDEAAKGMLHMINEMLTLSSLEAPQAKVDCVPFDLSAAAEKATLQMESVAFDRGVTLEEEIAENVTALGTPEIGERICNSLLENALKYEPDGGRVRVTLTQEKKRAVFTVQNYGSVIAEEDLPHIFERFYRSDKARGTAGGHGLGLPILQQAASLIDAEITVESNPDVGTIFHASLHLHT